MVGAFAWSILCVQAARCACPRVFTPFRSVQYQRPLDVVDLRDSQSLSRGRVRMTAQLHVSKLTQFARMLTLLTRKKGTSTRTCPENSPKNSLCN